MINKALVAKREFTQFMDNAFIVNTLRGTDSAGVFQVDKNFKPFMHKMNVPGYMFAEAKQAKRFFSDADSSLLTVGHVRAATHGKVNIDNAHPFVMVKPDGSRLIGVHNGTINNWKSQKGADDYDVDSEWALNEIAKDGVDAFERFAGSYAFVWWDESTPDKVYMARNKDRPLHFLQTQSKDSILFGSEAGMLSWLAERAKIDTAESIYSLEEQKLYTFDLSKTGNITWSKINLPVYKYISTTTSSSTTRGATCGVTYPRYREGSRGRWDHNTGKWVDVPKNNIPGAAEYGDDGDWGDNSDDVLGWPQQGGYGYTQHNATRGASGGSSRPVSFPLGAEKLVDEVKAALGKNRSAISQRKAAEREAAAPATDALAIHTEHKKALRLSKRDRKKQRIAETKAAKVPEPKEEAKLTTSVRTTESAGNNGGDYICPPHWFSNSSATSAEQQAAESKGVMGELQWFKGAFFEPETGELYGDIEEYIPGAGGGKMVHIGIMRNMSAAASDQNWINNKEVGGWVAVVGMTEQNRMDTSVALVVTPLTEAGLKQMKQQAA